MIKHKPFIGIVLPKIPAYSETFFNMKLKNLQRTGFNVIVFASKAKGEEESIKNNYQVVTPYPVKFKFSNYFMFMKVIMRILLYDFRPAKNLYFLERKDGKGIFSSLRSVYINAHFLPFKLDWLHFGFATMAINRENVAQSIGAKSSVSLRGFDMSVYPLKNPGCYDLLWRKVDKVHTISEFLYKKALNYGLSTTTPWKKIVPAIDIKVISKHDPSVPSFSNKIDIVTVARLHWIKGLDYAISAMAILKSRGMEFSYIIIGKGDEYEKLKFATYQQGICEEVIFTGALEHDKTLQVVKNCDIYLQPSIEEGFCNAVLEAQALGKLVVASDGGALNENVINNITGWIVPKRDSHAIARKIIAISKMSKEEKENVIKNAVNRVKGIFLSDQQKQSFVDFYAE